MKSRTMLAHYLQEVANFEFRERDGEALRMVAGILQEMNARGITYSTMTLDAIAEFFAHEFLARCDFLKEFVIAHPSLLLSEGAEDPITTAQTAYQVRSMKEQDKVLSLYTSSSARIVPSLQNEGMKKQIKGRLEQSMEDRIRKNNLYVEIAYREISISKNLNSKVLLLQPNVRGVGVDLIQLYRQYLEPILRHK